MDKGRKTDDGRIRFGNDVMSVIYWESCCDELKRPEEEKGKTRWVICGIKTRNQEHVVSLHHARTANAGRNRFLTEPVLPIDAPAAGSRRWSNVTGQPDDDETNKNNLIHF